MTRLAALDLGSGTIKLSVFEKGPSGYAALALSERNTELRRGMGPELLLQPEPVAQTLDAVAELLVEAKALGLERVPAYATSAVRKAKNPQALLGPLKDRFGIAAKVLSEDDEGRLNLFGMQSRSNAPITKVKTPNAVLDPGGDSSELCGGADLKTAPVASLPFGSVSLQEKFGSAKDNAPLDWPRLQAVIADATSIVRAFDKTALVLSALGTPPVLAIRMNHPIQRALEQVNQRPLTAHGEGGLYARSELEALCKHLASLDHGARASLLAGEPVGKVDRTCYGFASWLGVLDALNLRAFQIEPWGIKLGAAVHFND